jgi:hypothetical protein
MIGGSRDAQNRCVPVISLFNAVMLMGLILRLRLVDAPLDQYHIFRRVMFANHYLFCHCLVSSPDPGLRRVSVLQEIKCKNYHGCYQQEVNQAGGDKATIKSN